MLKMECPRCKKVIHSNLLSEVKVVFCKNCKANVPVQDVYVTAKEYTMRRDDLIVRIYRYEKLLIEAEKEREAMIKNRHMSEESIKSIDKFTTALRELLDGARNNFRVRTPHTMVKYKFDNNMGEGRLVDLSVVGACIEPNDINLLPRIKDYTFLNFSLPKIDAPFSIKGKVVWVKQGAKNRNFNTGIGVKFEELEETTRTLLWSFIAMQDAEGSRSVAGE